MQSPAPPSSHNSKLKQYSQSHSNHNNKQQATNRKRKQKQKQKKEATMIFVMQQHPPHPFLRQRSPCMMGAQPCPSPSMRHRHRHPCQAPTSKETPTTATGATTSNSNNTSTSKIDVPSIKITDGGNDSDSHCNFVITLDVPGYHLNNIDISLKPDDHVDAMVLEIKGKRDNRVYSASFEKRFRLRDSRLDMEKVDAELSDGLLTITLPKKHPGEDGGRRVIHVRDGASSSTSSRVTGDGLAVAEAKTAREKQEGQPQLAAHADTTKVEVEDVNEEEEAADDEDIVDRATKMDDDNTSDGNGSDDSEWEKFEA